VLDRPEQGGGILQLGLDRDAAEEVDLSYAEAGFLSLGVELDPGEAAAPGDAQQDEHRCDQRRSHEEDDPHSIIIDTVLIYLIREMFERFAHN